MESAFAVIAEPNRRAILGLLLASDRSVGELERDLQLSQPSVSKHLRVLREAGLVESRIEAQRRLYRLSPAPLKELDEWLTPFRRFWSKHVDALERHLETMEDVAFDDPPDASALRNSPPKGKRPRIGRSRSPSRTMKGRKKP